jgi:hypothetical protein
MRPQPGFQDTTESIARLDPRCSATRWFPLDPRLTLILVAVCFEGCYNGTSRRKRPWNLGKVVRSNWVGGGWVHMAEIEVRTSDLGDRYECQVTVRERRGTSQHQVKVRKADYERLAGGQASPEELVTESFRFLLEREPKESILRSFDIMVINRYFPEYEREIAMRL